MFHLDADRVLAGDYGRCAGGPEGHLDVALEAGDLLDARAEVEREGVLGDDGPAM